MLVSMTNITQFGNFFLRAETVYSSQLSREISITIFTRFEGEISVKLGGYYTERIF